jgi:hypothetical protein
MNCITLSEWASRRRVTDATSNLKDVFREENRSKQGRPSGSAGDEVRPIFSETDSADYS